MHWNCIQGKHGDQSNSEYHLDTQVQPDHLWSNPLRFTKTDEELLRQHNIEGRLKITDIYEFTLISLALHLYFRRPT